MESQRLTFVVGTGRCGSTALSEVLRLHPEVLSVSELFASVSPGAIPEEPLRGAEFWHLLASPRPFAGRMIREGVMLPEYRYPRSPGRFSVEGGGIPAICMITLPHLTDDPDALFDALAARITARPSGPAADHYRALFGLLSEACGGRSVVERSGYSLRSVPRLRQAFPEARFVHLFRDGADCALSMSRHPGFRMIQLMRHAAGEDPADGGERLPEDLEALVADDSFDLLGFLEQPVPAWRFGELWSETVIEGLGHLDAVPEPLRMALSYESLLAEPERRLTELAGHLGVEPLPQWLTAARRFLDGARRGKAQGLPAAELAALRDSCAPGTLALNR